MTQHSKNSSHPYSHLSDQNVVEAFAWPKDSNQIPALRIQNVALHERRDIADGLMSDMIFKLRVNQLVTTLHKQGLDHEANVMLGVLESLVIAGEIPFTDFIQRVQNLFPHVFDEIDPQLRENLLRMLAD